MDGQQVCSTDQPLQLDEPELVPADQGEQGGGEADFEEIEVGQHSHLDIEAVVGGGPGEGGGGVEAKEDEEFYSCSSVPSTPHSGESGGV